MHQPDHPSIDRVLRTLRDLVPRRRLTHGESLRLAELQANRLLELFDIRGPLVPDELVTELPHIAVRYDPDLPVSGSAHWESGHWMITLNGSEPRTRQRFSLMHEFKHILDHPTKQYLYGHDSDDWSSQHAEYAAEVFAAALLMPKRWIKSLWYESGQNLHVLARRAGVSSRALQVRLYHLGLASETPRCSNDSVGDQRSKTARPTYLRSTEPLLEAAA